MNQEEEANTKSRSERSNQNYFDRHLTVNGVSLSDTSTNCDAKVANYQISKAKSGKMPGRMTNDIIIKSGARLTNYISKAKSKTFVGDNSRCMAKASLTSLPSEAQGWPLDLYQISPTTTSSTSVPSAAQGLPFTKSARLLRQRLHYQVQRTGCPKRDASTRRVPDQ